MSLTASAAIRAPLPVPRFWPWLLAGVLVLLPALVAGVGAYQLIYHVSDPPEFTPVMTERFAEQLHEQSRRWRIWIS